MLSFFQVYEHLFTVMLINSLAGISLYWSLRAGLFNLSAAGFMSIGAYVSAILTLRAHTPWFLNVLAAMLLGGAIGAGLALPAMRLKSHYLAMATLGFGAIIQVLAVNLESLTNGMQGLVDIPEAVHFWQALLVIAFTIYLTWVIEQGRIGRAWQAIRMDTSAAASMGIDVNRYKLLAFVLSSAGATVAGGLWAHVNRVIVPTEFGFKRLTDILAAVLMGGTTHWSGPILGATVLTGLPEVFSRFDEVRPVLTGATLLLVVVYLRGGLVDLWQLGSRRSRTAQPMQHTAAAKGGAALASGTPEQGVDR